MVITSRWTRTGLLGAALLFSACAGGSRRPPENPSSARQQDTAPEKVAALRTATPGLHLEDEDARWGITAARERKRAKDEQRKKAATMTDIRMTPSAEVAPVLTKP